jgi:sarcosine oxidase subunit alpha
LTKRLVDDALDRGAELQTGSVVAGVFPGNELLVVGDHGGSRITADALVLATGSTDLPFPFAGATYPGVFSGRALQVMLNQRRVRPGRRFAVIGTGSLADELAVDILLAGGEIAWSGIAPAPFMRADGENGVRKLTIGLEQVAMDVIAIAVGRQADTALAAMASVPLGFAAALGGLVPAVGDRLECEKPNLFVAGDAAGVGSVAAAIAEGRLAGASAAAAIGKRGDDEAAAALSLGGAELAWRMAERASLQALHAQPFQ